MILYKYYIIHILAEGYKKIVPARKIESLTSGCFWLWAVSKRMFTCPAAVLHFIDMVSLFVRVGAKLMGLCIQMKSAWKRPAWICLTESRDLQPCWTRSRGVGARERKKERGGERERQEKRKREREKESGRGRLSPRQAALTLFTTKSHCLMWPRGPRPPTRSHRMCCGWDATWLTSAHRASLRQTLFLTALASPPHHAAHQTPLTAKTKDLLLAGQKSQKSPPFPFYS